MQADHSAAKPAPLLDRLGLYFDRGIETVCGLLLLSTCLIACVQVFFRYVLNSSLPWPEELARFAFVWLVFAGMAIGARRGTHLRINLTDQLFSESWKRRGTLFSQAIMSAVCIMLIIHGLDLAGRASTVTPAMEWPIRWLFYAIPAGATMTLFMLAITPRTGIARWQCLGSVIAGALVYIAIRFALAGVVGLFSTSAVLVVVGLGLVFAGVPIAFALVFGTFAAFAPKNPLVMVTISQNMTSALDSFLLLAIPFFIMAAAFMNAGGITERLVELATRLVGHFRGGLGHVNVVTNTMMAGVSGSSMADAAAIGKIMVPSMAKRGYPRAFSCALTSASSVIANLIPPSLALIIYGALASVSVGALFIATILPGFLVAGALLLVVAVKSRQSGYGAGTPVASRRDRFQALISALPALILPVLIVGGVRLGVFTATEAGAMAFLYAVFCGAFLYRKLTVHTAIAATRDALQDTLAVMVVIAAASPFAWVLASERVPQIVGGALGNIAENPVMLLLLINLMLLVVGLFMELIAAMVILVPILVPLTMAAGVDPVHFGIVVVINLVIGALTPPLGMLVFTTARVGNVEATAVFRAVLPFVAALICVLLVVTFVPFVSLGLTHLIAP